jgi:response regulator RpfG family c-di-GMP phosphodiesterase
MSSSFNEADVQSDEAPQDTLLIVDDEANILSSLKRLFRAKGYRIFTAQSGIEGLAILEQEAIDLIISDMRMPEMNGAQFLEKARERWPDTVRILLTGYADITSTIDAINKGQIHRYISKPWEDQDLLSSVHQTLEHTRLRREKQRLEALTQSQNEELKQLNDELKGLNASLEEKVKARTEEVRQTMNFLEAAHERLKKTFLTSVRVFSTLVEMREGEHAGQSRHVAEHAKLLAMKMSMTEHEVQDVMLAALLRDIGKMGWPEKLIRRPYFALTTEERAEVVKHPITGQKLLMELEQLHGVATLIRSHHERYDGQGFPDMLKGHDIPLGARIITVVNDYDGLQHGGLMSNPMKADEAAQYILDHAGSAYDPIVVDKYIQLLKEIERKTNAQQPVERAMQAPLLAPGMVLSRDLLDKDGMLLLGKEATLTEGMITQLINFEKSEKQRLTIYVHNW